MLDGILNGNPFAQKLNRVYAPIARQSISVPAGLIIDVLYGFVMAAVFLLLYESLPGGTGLVKGVSYGVIIWFFRMVMYAATQWMTLRIPGATLLYIVVTGLVEMVLLGLLYGAGLRP